MPKKKKKAERLDMYTVILRVGCEDSSVMVCVLTKEELLEHFNTQDEWGYHELTILRENTFGYCANEFPSNSILIIKNGEVVIPEPAEVKVTKFKIK